MKAIETARISPLSLPAQRLLVGLVIMASSLLQASVNEPMFLSNNMTTDPETGVITYFATVHGTVFQWVSAQEFEDGVHVDSFACLGGNLTIQGNVSNTSLATVSGTTGTENISGYIQYGSFSDSVVAHYWGTGLTANGRSYNWTSGSTYTTVDFQNSTLRVSSITDSYSGDLGSVTITTDGEGNGTVSGAENGVVYHGTPYLNGATNYPFDGGNYSLFGKTFAFTGGWQSWSTSTDDFSILRLHSSIGEDYSSAQGDCLSVYFDPTSYPYSGSFSGYDPLVGTFSGVYSYSHNLSFDPRVSPSFVTGATTLWLEDVPFLFQNGSLSVNGDIVDTYVSSNDPGVSISIQANLPSFKDGGSSAQAVVQVRNESTLITQGSYTADGTVALDDGRHIDTYRSGRSGPFFTGGASIWVDGSQLDFVSGFDTSSLGKSDTYANASVGMVTLRGTDSGQASVTFVSYNQAGVPVSGNYSQGNFTMSDSSVTITTQAQSNIPAFWLAGVVYVRSGSSLSYAGPNGELLSLSGSTGNATLSGNDGTSSFTGTYANNGKVFTVSFEGGTVCVAYPANTDGSIWHSNAELPAGLPPAIALPGSGGRIWQFLSSAPDETDPTMTSAYYGNAAARTVSGSLADHSCLLKIRTDGTVILSDYANWQDFTGTYDTQSHLFQSSRDQRLPMPLFCVNPVANNMLWGQATPAAGLPVTVLVGGEVWRYVGDDSNGAAVYKGYYGGQQMLLSPNPDGSYAISLVDVYGGNASGTYRNGTFQVVGRKVVGSDGQGHVLTGFAGVTSISGDLDILGNVVTLGSLKGDVNATGVTLSFTDDGTTASLVSGLNRPAAEWLWNHAGATVDSPAVPMMKLDSSHRLQLFNPANPATPAIVLDPASGSRINGPLRVPPSGDLGMGEFTHGPRPDGTVGN